MSPSAIGSVRKISRALSSFDTPRGREIADGAARRSRERFGMYLQLLRHAGGERAEVFVQHAVARSEDVQTSHIRDRSQRPAKQPRSNPDSMAPRRSVCRVTKRSIVSSHDVCVDPIILRTIGERFAFLLTPRSTALFGCGPGRAASPASSAVKRGQQRTRSASAAVPQGLPTTSPAHSRHRGKDWQRRAALE